ncbi:proton-conducting transporter membrane subunit [Methanonatronarchaeum sp. AMET-Sl]|uniref:proton-conducting transporter transmembrane domain-containing protein n=1 Tax=Methanonatronarchaeum sp. AMET-Sl TaxID=3037654 RepID=UPI00244DE9B7|nr:proton-conducting transporter membrane subunit [Methanonatronarchaeum sp. AMET-Sl]WGI16712.1 proton-conducting transporter membrane subunit [Methanonatronarchaeum sp. AMET-Sl]
MMDYIDYAPILAIMVPLLAGFATPLIARLGETAKKVWTIAGLAIALTLVLVVFARVIDVGIMTYATGAAVPTELIPGGMEQPIRVVLEVDGMGAFAALGITLTTFLASIFSWRYFDETGMGTTGFYTLLLLLGAAGIAFAFTGDLFNLFVFIELSSITAIGLIAFYSYRGRPNEAAFKFLLLSAVGALMFLIAVGFLYGQYNALSIGVVADRMMETGLGTIDKLALALMVGSLAMKAGAVPLHMWVPDTYGEAPAHISMVLVTLSQLSLYALFRISFSLYGVNLDGATLGWIIVILGLLTMFIGVMLAIIQKTIKRLMAYHAISQTGYMLLGVGVGLVALMSGEIGEMPVYGYHAMEGGIFHIINHAIYKGLLFLTAGAIIYKTNVRSLNDLGSLAREMPFTSIAFIIGAAAIAGLPPFNGFASKILIYESVYALNPFLTAVAMLVSVITLASFVKVFQSTFLGPEKSRYKGVGEVPTSMKTAMFVLAALTVLFGLFPDLVVDTIVAPAVEALIDQTGYIGGILE